MPVLSAPYFYNEADAFQQLQATLWPNGPVCPRCGNLERITAVRSINQPKNLQSTRFIEAARSLGADEDEAAFKAKLAVIARQKPKDEPEPQQEGPKSE